MAIMGTLFSLMFFSKQFPDVQLFGIFLVVTSDYTQKKYKKTEATAWCRRTQTWEEDNMPVESSISHFM